MSGLACLAAAGVGSRETPLGSQAALGSEHTRKPGSLFLYSIHFQDNKKNKWSNCLGALRTLITWEACQEPSPDMRQSRQGLCLGLCDQVLALI